MLDDTKIQTIIDLRDNKNMSFTQISKIFNCSAATVQKSYRIAEFKAKHPDCNPPYGCFDCPYPDCIAYEIYTTKEELALNNIFLDKQKHRKKSHISER